MFHEKTKEGAAQAAQGKLSQEKTRNGEATLRNQQKGTHVHREKTNKISEQYKRYNLSWGHHCG
jgi:hypothetical protein